MKKTKLLIFSGLVHSILAYYFHWVLFLLVSIFYYTGALLGINRFDEGEEQFFIVLLLVTILACATYFLIIISVNRLLINGAYMSKRSCLFFNGSIFVTVALIRSIVFIKEQLYR
ncbi:hypothetical protein [Paenibacillus sp. FSL R5-0470]|uniref:hypothetical protein n=1 Tax=Paenibacillus sp. FSL R5-0470 TaxID=2921641 RepID=UPI0030DD9AE2